VSEVLFQAILPSGRAVRFVPLLTEDALNIQAMVAQRLGRNEAKAHLAEKMVLVEMVAKCTRAITERRPWLFQEVTTHAEEPESAQAETILDEIAPRQSKPRVLRVADTARMLAEIPPNEWITLSYTDLISRDGPRRINAVLGALPDFNTLVGLINNPYGVELQGDVGKAQTVAG